MVVFVDDDVEFIFVVEFLICFWIDDFVVGFVDVVYLFVEEDWKVGYLVVVFFDVIVVV